MPGIFARDVNNCINCPILLYVRLTASRKCWAISCVIADVNMQSRTTISSGFKIMLFRRLSHFGLVKHVYEIVMWRNLFDLCWFVQNGLRDLDCEIVTMRKERCGKTRRFEIMTSW